MALKTREDYLAALRNLRPNIYKFGELIEDVTTHPATKRTVESHALNYDGANDPDLEQIYATTSIFTGEKTLRWNSMMQSMDDLIGNIQDAVVMSNNQNGTAPFFRQLHQKLYDISTRSAIERRSNFICQNQPRTTYQRSGDRHSLLLSS